VNFIEGRRRQNMKKTFKVLLFAVLAVFLLNTSAFAVMQHFQATVYKKDISKYGEQGEPSANLIALTGITYTVLAKGSTTAETLYSGSGWGSPITSKTNPVTTTVYGTDGGRIDFYCDPTDAVDDTYVDLLVTDTTGGFSAIVRGFSSKMHSVVIDETPGISHIGVIWFTSAVSATEVSTGVNFLYDTFVEDVRVQVVATTSGATVGVGLLSSQTAGNATGFRAGVLLTTAGYIKDTAVITNGNTIDYTPVTTYGPLLFTAITGSDVIATVGGRSYIGHVITGTNAYTLTYTVSAGTTGTGFIFYKFTVLH
jgi:hypothetical protein